ncbi:MAG: phosphoribosyltransferase family protein [Fimbriiglobus sp.]
MRRWLSDLVDGAIRLVAPPSCLLCQTPTEKTHFCQACLTKLTTDPFSNCPRCASSLGPHVQKCLSCDGEKFAFESAQRLGPYDGLLRDAVLQMKSLAGASLAYRLGEAWGTARRDTLDSLGAQVVMPIPLHWGRTWERGYNQALELALGLGQTLGLPVWRRALIRSRATTMQSSLSGAERRANLKGAFVLRSGYQVRNITVLLVDDVLTTGATCDAASQALKQAGAAQVHAVVLAHR